MTPTGLGIVIANWNGADYLDACLASIAAHSEGLDARVIVVDNGSTDDSVRRASSWSGRLTIEVVELPTNVGYALANNVGFERVSEDLCLFLNNDTVVGGPLDQALGYFSKRPGVGIAQGLLLTIDGRRIDSVGSFITRLGFLLHPLRNQAPCVATTETRIFSAKGAAMFTRTSCLRDIGLFDSTTFAYWEESDLCWRARLAGWDVVFSPDLPLVYHVGGRTARHLGATRLEFHSYKNRLRSIIKNGGGRTLVTMLPLHLGSCAAAAAGAVVIGRPVGALNVFRAMIWNARMLRSTLAERRAIQRRRRLSDREALAEVMVSVRARDFLLGLRAYARWYKPD